MDNPLEAGSPPPSQLDEEAPRPLPSLPTEILQRIIQLALPRLSFNTFPERYNILLTCCRVNKLWAALAQMELTPHVWITENNTVQQHFLPAFKMGDRPALRSLWLQDEAATDVPALLATGQSIPRLYVSSDEPLLTLQVIDLLQISQQLEVLALDYCTLDFEPRQGRVPFPRLRRLAISCLLGVDWPAFLTALDAPNLRDLSITSSDEYDDEELVALNGAVAGLAPKLQSFSFVTIHSIDPCFLGDDVWQHFTSLQHLTFHHDAELLVALEKIPLPLKTLRLRAPTEEHDSLSFAHLLNVLASRPPSIEKLEQLVIPPSGVFKELNREEAASVLPSQREQLEQWCESPGIELVHQPEVGYTGFMRHIQAELSGC